MAAKINLFPFNANFFVIFFGFIHRLARIEKLL